MTYFMQLIMRLWITNFKLDKDGLPIINPQTEQAIRHLLYCANPLGGGRGFDYLHLRDLINGNMEAAKKFCMTCGMALHHGVRDVKCSIDSEKHDQFDTCDIWVTDLPQKNRIIAGWGELCLPGGYRI